MAFDAMFGSLNTAPGQLGSMPHPAPGQKQELAWPQPVWIGVTETGVAV